MKYHLNKKVEVILTISLLLCVPFLSLAMLGNSRSIRSVAKASASRHAYMVMKDNGPQISELPLGNPGVLDPKLKDMGKKDIEEVNSRPPNNKDNFRVWTPFTHFAYDDPIVYPGRPGASHLHMFLGNSSINAFTTKDNIRQCVSAAQGGTLNCSGYWIPALFNNKGEPQLPYWDNNDRENRPRANTAMIYYKSHHVKDFKKFQAPPVGLAIIAGNAKATPANPQDTKKFGWSCSTGGGRRNHIPNCPPGSELKLSIRFPQCWDGKSLDSPNHKDHITYSNGTKCPSTHPVPIPKITFNLKFKVGPEGTRGWRLSSDAYEVTEKTPGGYSIHADWLNGWDPSTAKRFVSKCIHEQIDCYMGTFNDGTKLSDDHVWTLPKRNS